MAEKRGIQTVRSMVISLGVVGIVVVALLIAGRHSEQDPVKRIDYSVKFQQASQDAPYPLLAPTGLPGRWRATSAEYQGMDPAATAWHVGLISPDGDYVAVEQSNGTPAPFVKDKSKNGTAVGERDVAGEQWQTYDGDKYRSLVRIKDGVTTVVTGTAPYDALAQFAAALKPSVAGQPING